MLPNAYEAGVKEWPESPLFLAALGNLYYTQGDLSLGARQLSTAGGFTPWLR